MIQCPHCSGVLYRNGDEDCLMEAVQVAGATLSALQSQLKSIETGLTTTTTMVIQTWNMLDEAQKAAYNARSALDDIKAQRAKLSEEG